METQSLHRGRLIDHIQLVVRDLDASRNSMTPCSRRWDSRSAARARTSSGSTNCSSRRPKSQAAAGHLTGRVHLAFQARDRAAVEAAYKAGLKAGGTDNGAPGERPYHPGYYAAFLIDPDGNNIEAVYHGPHERLGRERGDHVRGVIPLPGGRGLEARRAQRCASAERVRVDVSRRKRICGGLRVDVSVTPRASRSPTARRSAFSRREKVRPGTASSPRSPRPGPPAAPPPPAAGRRTGGWARRRRA